MSDDKKFQDRGQDQFILLDGHLTPVQCNGRRVVKPAAVQRVNMTSCSHCKQSVDQVSSQKKLLKITRCS